MNTKPLLRIAIMILIVYAHGALQACWTPPPDCPVCQVARWTGTQWVCGAGCPDSICCTGLPDDGWGCCPAYWQCCISAGGQLGCCDQYGCETCVDGQCVYCAGSAIPQEFQGCCNGTCYDARTHKCCTDTATPYVCEKDKACCNGTCCEDNQCCYNGECKLCCKDATTGNCEKHNSDCGCDPPGPASCTDKRKEWTLGSSHFCYSECGGEPCDYTMIDDKDCYATQACVQIPEKHWGKECGPCGEIPPCRYDYCVPSVPTSYCQNCEPTGDAEIVEAYDCRCD